MKKALLITPRFMGLDQLIFEELKKSISCNRS
jgi:hypothetical protein